MTKNVMEFAQEVKATSPESNDEVWFSDSSHAENARHSESLHRANTLGRATGSRE